MYYKLSDYARKFNVTYRTAWNHFNEGKIKGAFKSETGTILIPLVDFDKQNNAIIYSRVSNRDAKDNLERQSERLYNYAVNSGYTIVGNYKEIASGLNDNRRKLNEIFTRNDWDVLIVENKDKLTRFGFNYIKILLNMNGKDVVVVNQTNDNKTDLMEDLISIIYSFSTRMNGLRRKKTKQEIKEFVEG